MYVRSMYLYMCKEVCTEMCTQLDMLTKVSAENAKRKNNGKKM